MASHQGNHYGGNPGWNGQSQHDPPSRRQDDYQSQGYNDPHQYGYHEDQHDQYRNDYSQSPEMHPGFAPSSQGYNQSPTRSQDPYSPSNNYSQSPSGAGASPTGTMPNQVYGNLAKYGAAGGHRPSTPNGNHNADYGSHNGGRGSPYSPYHQYNQPQSSHASYSSVDPLTTSAAPPSMSAQRGNFNDGGYDNHTYHSAPRGESPIRPHHPAGTNHPYQNPYDNHSISRNNLNGMDQIDPNNVIVDDDDFGGPARSKRKSMISLNRRSMGSTPALAGAAAGGAAIGLGSMAASQGSGEMSKSMYANTSVPRSGTFAEKPLVDPIKKSDLEEEAASRKKKKIFFIIIFVLVLLGVAGGVTGAVIATRKNDDKRDSTATTGDNLDGTSSDVKKLLNNKNLHKVFTGMAYTPMSAQYPDCLKNPPSQNNVTKDMALMSQLTNVVRLYGTDCNQTELVLTAIEKLKLTDMKIWIGVWLDKNTTTNTRQVHQLWDVIDKHGTKNVKGVAVGNEVLFREDLTITQLRNEITYVRNNMTQRGIQLPVGSSDLGDNWTADLASSVDYVMSNVHPFFGGVAVEQAASWTWSFWQSHDVAITKGMPQKHIISEVGWPSGGGQDCGAGVCQTSTSGAIAGIPQMNTFLESWVCPALNNGTQYFYFSLADEPWKVRYNTPGKEWEDKWGLFDYEWNLKPGLKIPDCGGKVIPAA